VTKGQSAASLPDVSLTVHAPAKINLILRILDRRADGYHNLWSLMHTVALEDILRITATPGRREIRLACDMEGLSTNHTNLVYKAASAVLEQAQVPVGAEIELRKRIPTGAGLGGGSSDAAATILGLNQLLKLGWSAAKMRDVGQALGSDVAFFLFAPSAIVSGRGETVRQVTVEGGRWIVLVKPEFGVETKWAYQELAATRTEVRPLSADHLEIDRRDRLTWREVSAAAENDFEKPVFAKHPLLQQIRRSLLELGAEFALLSGSGATVFGLFEDEPTARRAADRVAEGSELKVFVVPTCFGHLRTSSRPGSQGAAG
jgi:4-diphosphocytidyl-2-C-methyl-D-erythritol kinase